MSDHMTTPAMQFDAVASAAAKPAAAVLVDQSDSLTRLVPGPWQDLVEILSVPIAWVPDLTSALFGFVLHLSGWMAVLGYLLLFLPVTMIVVGVWLTQLSIYTLPFRSGRLDFIKSILMAWWDAAVAIWYYWVGLGRFLIVLLGWVFTLGRLGVQMLVEVFRQLIILPFSKTGQMTQSYFQPGVPWVAFILVMFWGLMEALIFTYTLFPMVTEVLAGIVGKEAPALTGTILYFFLAFLILGSFACLHALAEAVKNKDYKFLVQMILVEIFVMVFEVMFLYRELVDAITPWIAQQTSESFRPGIWFTLSLATFGWIGIRGMTWFLFGQYGTPPLLAFISRRPLLPPDAHTATTQRASVSSPPWWREPVEDFKREIGWLHEKVNELLEYVTLPFIHLLAGTLNFPMILVTGRPAFSIPFKNLQEALQIRENLPFARLQPKKASA